MCFADQARFHYINIIMKWSNGNKPYYRGILNIKKILKILLSKAVDGFKPPDDQAFAESPYHLVGTVVTYNIKIPKTR